MKRVFEYIYGEYASDRMEASDTPFDGNDMVEANNKMQEKGDWEKFHD